jgi:nicotinamidase-related amidase
MNPSTLALVLLDFQPPPLNSLGDRATAILDRASAALAWARERGVTVAHVRVGFTPDDFGAIPERNKVFGGLRSGQRFVDGTPDCEFVESMRPQAGEIVARKTRLSAFSTTDLAERLRATGVETLILAGQSTSGVVLSTVREGADLDFGLMVLSDASGDADEEYNAYLMGTVFPRQCDVITTADLVELVD